MQNIFEIINAILGAIYIFFIPGFVISFLFFARGAIEIIERVALSFALSVAIVPLAGFLFKFAWHKDSYMDCSCRGCLCNNNRHSCLVINQEMGETACERA
jgi:hypothetical protein